VIGGELNVDVSLRESELEISVGGGGSARKLGSQTRGGRGKCVPIKDGGRVSGDGSVGGLQDRCSGFA
jgi:hypothetical protein